MIQARHIVRSLCLLFALAALGNAQSSTPAPKPLAYSLVAIHPHKPGDESWTINSHDDGFTANGATFSDLFDEGYSFGFGPIAEQQISGFPAWCKTERFDVVAKVDVDDIPAFKKATDVSMTEMIANLTNHTPTVSMHMMQQLLAEHFQLKVHTVQRELPVYALVLAKGGAKLAKPADTEHGNLSFGNGELKAAGVPLAIALSFLASQLGRPILDRTGLTGSYDFTLRWTPDADAGNDAGKPDAPGLFTALQEQLGLKLEPSKGLIDTFVIDHVEKPAGN